MARGCGSPRRLGLSLALLALLATWPAGGQTISLTGSWTLSVSAADLIAGAGSDFSTPLISADNQVLITISGTAGNSPWDVTVYKIDSPGWPAGLTLRVIRTGDGTGTGSINGGTDPGVVVPDGAAGAAAFFDGRRARSNVPVRLRLEGLSVDLGPPAIYTTTVYYTVN